MLNNTRKILLIDRDGTINKKSQSKRYIENISEIEIINESKIALKKLSCLGFKFIVITNQACINKGIITKEELFKIHEYIKKKLYKEKIEILDFFICPHTDKENCNCRKPLPGMFNKCAKKYDLDLRRLLYVGDDVKDCYAAKNAGSGYIYLGKSKDLRYTEFSNTKCYKNFLMAVDDIINFYR